MPRNTIDEAVADAFLHVVKITSRLEYPIAADIVSDATYVTLCPIYFRLNGQKQRVPAGFAFDGPSIPRIFFFIPGFAKSDHETLLASCIHDWLLESGMIRVMADAWFASTLAGATLNGRPLRKCRAWRARWMYYAVRWWSRRCDRKAARLVTRESEATDGPMGNSH